MERIEHPKWKVRLNAYKEINSLFYNEYSKGCVDYEKNESDKEESSKPFEIYGPVLHKIIVDSNLIAQYEGLNCLFSYVKFCNDIKSIIFQVHSILLEKIHHNKPNFKEITIKIILCILKKDKGYQILGEILKRFKSKNTKVALFSTEIIV